MEADDWYDDIEEAPEDKRRELILNLVREALRENVDHVTVRTLAINFDKRTVSIDGRTYGPIQEAGFVAPLVNTTSIIMPTRSTEPW